MPLIYKEKKELRKNKAGEKLKLAIKFLTQSVDKTVCIRFAIVGSA